MPILTDEIESFVRQMRLGFVATVNPDGTPSLSPKGTLTVWDHDHLVFADLHSPTTVENLRLNPAIEVNVIDPILRKGYRFKGKAELISDGDLFKKILRFYDEHGVIDAPRRIHTVVLVQLEQVRPVVSPGYEFGETEDQVRERWEAYYNSIHSPMFRKS